eukprot:3291-Karenia_brevis.AAC.1
MTGWRHASPGNHSHWEHPLVDVYGDAWWDAPSSSLKLWRSTKREFVKKLCSQWSVDVPDDTGLPEEGRAHGFQKGSISIQQWTEKDLEWGRRFRSFDCRVDNQLLAEWLSGASLCKTSSYESRVAS